jgi:hypothetical protein
MAHGDWSCTLWCSPRDERLVEPPRPRKSVGAEVNWGVRFTSDQEAAKFMQVGVGRGLAGWEEGPGRWGVGGGHVYGCLLPQ